MQRESPMSRGDFSQTKPLLDADPSLFSSRIQNPSYSADGTENRETTTESDDRFINCSIMRNEIFFWEEEWVAGQVHALLSRVRRLSNTGHDDFSAHVQLNSRFLVVLKNRRRFHGCGSTRRKDLRRSQ